MKRQFLYVYVTRRHLGWGTHFGYSGRTCRPDLRDGQHRKSQPWADLIVKRHVIPLGRVPVFVAGALEWVLIKITLPVYNVQHNKGNPRRVTPYNARQQRWARDGAKRSPWGVGAMRRIVAARPSKLSLVPVAVLVTVALALWSR